jgi:hypothetical protein
LIIKFPSVDLIHYGFPRRWYEILATWKIKVLFNTRLWNKIKHWITSIIARKWSSLIYDWVTEEVFRADFYTGNVDLC